MSYLVLARKWRPMQFEEVVAQNHVTTTLVNAIKQNRLASAYLFSGPRGVGKTTTARILAKAINCEQGPTTTPCNACSSCKEITESRSLDVFEIDGASNRGIDEVRNLRENLKYSATKGKHKIYIIDEVHMLTTEAFNALLKTLEEPPPNVLFIFATTEPHKVPATILSRCQRYDFRRMPLNEIVQQLQTICAEENIKIDEESLYLVAKKSEGSMRDSLSILDQVVSFSGAKVSINELSELLGIIDQELYFDCTDCLVKKDLNRGLTLVESVFKQGYDIGEFLNGLIEHFRNMLVLKATGNLNLIEGGDSYNIKYKDMTEKFSETDLLRLIQLASETVYQIKRSSNPKMMLEILLVKMIKMDKSVELDQLLSHISGIKKSPVQTVSPNETNPVPNVVEKVKVITGGKSGEAESHNKQQNQTHQATHSSSNSSETDSASLNKLKALWPQIINEVKGKKIHLGSFLNEGYPTGLHGGTLEISFGKENGFHINTINQNRHLIQEVIFEHTGYRLKIQCRKHESEEFQDILVKHKPAKEPQMDPEVDENTQIPILKKVIELFDGEIVTQA
ncbi:DNA polymerase III subunit gamma/tau [candidate division KSB1 bacterium]|nr:DNA polymerase III subunit gamma/tau [candidate division KSB1 bacterium]NIR69599.1 DNA polymerase III subunit gamma/tau [candidate division KSB1 bacterium]NIS24316.1 DNA polymerase III subunit gamma/tau [candidate division KSB1 bacterium]NIT71244.1 DNA polymerase III subunit gamma/tau [candidate division KSB1 bacterium]NIU24948.1 DNA polymerase III subunit gamma/tau [candidate division KSB1 bacterium]